MMQPDLFKLKALFAAERYYKLPLRLAFLGLLRCCDCACRFYWQPIKLQRDILPYDDIDFNHVLNALVTLGFIIKQT